MQYVVSNIKPLPLPIGVFSTLCGSEDQQPTGVPVDREAGDCSRSSAVDTLACSHLTRILGIDSGGFDQN